MLKVIQKSFHTYFWLISCIFLCAFEYLKTLGYGKLSSVIKELKPREIQELLNRINNAKEDLKLYEYAAYCQLNKCLNKTTK